MTPGELRAGDQDALSLGPRQTPDVDTALSHVVGPGYQAMDWWEVQLYRNVRYIGSEWRSAGWTSATRR